MNFHPVDPEDAATVILVREEPAGLKVYMTRRQESLAFLGGYYVFPGGKVDPGDRGEELMALCPGFEPERAPALVAGVTDPVRAMSFFLAGLRELFEETGILLAEDGEDRPLAGRDPAFWERLKKYRKDLQRDRIAFAELLRQEGLFLHPSRLLWFAHWITPAFSPRRFSTFFFLARKPEGQSAEPFAEEIAAAVWVKPEDALDKWRAREWPMIPPTIASLDALARYRSWQELAADFSRPAHEYPRTVFTGP